MPAYTVMRIDAAKTGFVLFLVAVLVYILGTPGTDTSRHSKAGLDENAYKNPEPVPGTNTRVFEPHTQNRISLKSDKVKVFYQVFTPKEQNKHKNKQHRIRVTTIVKDQLSYVKSFHEVIINTVGQRLDIASICPECHHQGHHDDGDEFVTLTALYNHCQTTPTDTVVYIHDKGSFHPTPENDQLRPFLTRGALSEDCGKMPDYCNLCSSHWAMLPHMHTPGNMWTARCSYINKLLPHKEFQVAQNDLRIRYSLQELGLAELGTGRYANERWVASHPHVRACDLYEATGSLAGYQRQDPMWATNPSSWDISLKRAPRREMEFYRLDIPPYKYCPYDDKTRVGWAIDLNSQLCGWHFLYGVAPEDDSWIWDYLSTSSIRKHIATNKMSYATNATVREITRLMPHIKSKVLPRGY